MSEYKSSEYNSSKNSYNSAYLANKLKKIIPYIQILQKIKTVTKNIHILMYINKLRKK